MSNRKSKSPVATAARSLRQKVTKLAKETPKVPAQEPAAAPTVPATTTPAAPAKMRRMRGNPKQKRAEERARQAAPKAATEAGNGKHPKTIAGETSRSSGFLLKIGEVYSQEVGSIAAAQGLYAHALAELADCSPGLRPETFPDGLLYKDGTQVARIDTKGRAFAMDGSRIGTIKDEPSEPAPVEELAPAMSVSLPIKYVNAALAIAAKKDVTRPYLCAIYVHQVEGNVVRLVASDGHRMIVLSTECDRKLNWGEQGVLLPRPDLDRIAKYAGKGPEVQLDVSFGPNHPAVKIAEHLGMAQFTVTPVDGKFVEYQRILNDCGEVIGSDEQLTPADTSAINRDYLKAAGVVASTLESSCVRPFIDPTGRRAAVFTFDDPGALLVVMPMRTEQPALRAPTMRLLGEAGMSRTIAALKAHETRCRKAASETKNKEERAKLEGQANVYAERIGEIRAVIAALPAPAAAPEAIENKAGEEASAE